MNTETTLTDQGALRALEDKAHKETDLAIYFEMPRAVVHAKYASLEADRFVSRDTQRPIRWVLTVEGRAYLSLLLQGRVKDH